MRVALALLFATILPAADWPEWRGAGRLGVWTEDGVLEKFPAEGLTAVWRKPISRGYAGPAVADGRVFVTELEPGTGSKGVERALCLDEETGERLWQREWPVDYAGLQYDLGPRATPTVDGDRVYVYGAVGDLLCLRASDGEVVWQLNAQRDFSAQLPTWGFTAAPLVVDDRLIVLLGGEPDAKVVAFDKRTGKELWRALSSDSEPGYSPPILIEVGGRRQVVQWTPQAVQALDPETGAVLWQQPFQANVGLVVATPVLSPHGLLVSSFYNGSRMYRLDSERPGAELIWKGNSNSEIETDGLHSLVTTPVVDGDRVYGIGSYGALRSLDARTGRRVWETHALTKEDARWASGQIVRQGDRYFINNDRGELVLARLKPEGFEEIDRTFLLEPTQPSMRRRELDAVHWTHPAYANRCLIIRNDREIVRYSLAARP
ncbi:MAG: PQQ-binding-like beta-propeller repeat protein [Acidobacteria bacterium]|nr:PQQ-binding-like beta-propeller repeat protein [Acidobacteriota bacterium]